MNGMDEKELFRRMEFHEKQMNKDNLPTYWKERSEVLYWYYLNLLTKTEA